MESSPIVSFGGDDVIEPTPGQMGGRVPLIVLGVIELAPCWLMSIVVLEPCLSIESMLPSSEKPAKVEFEIDETDETDGVAG